ncbi:unnamed protein product [Rotaria sordida]|uniref:Uncharacterized protein n=1 Tax=Rotaria sordida TaxID=392033 RepID=A0A814A8N9_9BILA|nr:unnamed protein product [Rotaria sordida]CAF3908488.1 unnamed protein product [Rotaria sordida]
MSLELVHNITKQTIGKMLYFQLINLLIIFGLINYSYEFNIQIKNLKRYIRNAPFKNETQSVLNQIFSDEQQLENTVRESIRKDDDIVKVLTRNIMLAADRMAEAGSKNTKSVTEWTYIQGELRKGINLIIEAYRKYIDLHRQVCETIENFAKNMINKYETELSAIDQMSVPNSSNGDIDTNSPEWNKFVAKFLHILNYARLHQETLRTATDCTGDLMTRTLSHQSVIMNQPGPGFHQLNIRINHPVSLQYPMQSFSLPCNDISEDNGYQTCSNAIADATQSYAGPVLE